MIKIYDDTDESTIPFDLKWSRAIILLCIAVSLIISTLALPSNNSFFTITKFNGIAAFIISGVTSIGLYYLMYRSHKYPSLFASLSVFLLGLSSYLTGFNVNLGIGIFTLSTIYAVIYFVLIRKFDIDKPI